MLPVAVLAGGLGTRVRSLTGATRPKALLDVAGRPFLDHKLEELASHGVDRVVLLLGHGAESVRCHVGDGSRYGLAVECVSDGPRLLGTAGAVRNALSRLSGAFWVTYGDTLLDAPMPEIERDFLHSDRQGLMAVLRNVDRWQPSNVSTRGSTVIAYEKDAPPGSHEYIDYGLLLFRASAFDGFPAGRPFDLGDVLRRLVASGQMGAYEVHRRFRDIGTPEARTETEKAVRARCSQTDDDRSRM